MKKSLIKRAVVLAVCLAALPLPAAGPGDEVIVIYNTRVPESKAVAEYYAARRKVPAGQIFGFALSTSIEMSRAEFRDELQKPLAETLERKKLWHISSKVIPGTNQQPSRVEWRVKESKIRYAVICYGVPTSILADGSIKEPGAEGLRPELRRNEAAVDSELALLPCIEQKLPLSGPINNPLFTATNEFMLHPTNGVLLIGRLDGPTAEIARGLVDKAMQAETNGLWGRGYFDVRNISEAGYKPGDDWINGAAEICRHLGYETTVDRNPGTFPRETPMSHIAIYCGWYDEEVSGPFTRANVEFMPGAFAYHLHSSSAVNVRSPKTFWVGPLLAKGATASMGCVYEPYLAGTPNMAVFVSRLLFFGWSFGASAYVSQPVLSWQITVVGDPLYRPCAKLQQLHEDFTRRHSPLLEWSWLRLANLNLANGTRTAEVVSLLEGLEDTKHSAVLTEKLGDLYSTTGKPSSAADKYERALALNPSPQQRVRLRLALADKYLALGRDADAAEEIGKILQENPDYPAKLDLYKRLLPLAQKLGKSEAAAQYEHHIRELTPPPPK